MEWIEYLILAIILALDAASICAVNGITFKPKLKLILIYSLPFALLQGLMPILGFTFIKNLPKDLLEYVNVLSFFILALLGLKMIKDCFKKENEEVKSISFKTLILQAIATSIDALAIGIAISHNSINTLMIIVIIVVVITYIACMISTIIGKQFGKLLSNKAQLVGGIILIILAFNFLFK